MRVRVCSATVSARSWHCTHIANFVRVSPQKKQVAGEFLGGSDIMIEMYQSGELGEMIEKAKADMV